MTSACGNSNLTMRPLAANQATHGHASNSPRTTRPQRQRPRCNCDLFLVTQMPHSKTGLPLSLLRANSVESASWAQDPDCCTLQVDGCAGCPHHESSKLRADDGTPT